MYINDLLLAVSDSSVSMYADDTSLCYKSLDINKLNEVVNSDLERQQKWSMGNNENSVNAHFYRTETRGTEESRAKTFHYKSGIMN